MLRNLRTAAFALLLVATSVTSPADADPLADGHTAVWVCPPCTGGCDEKTYDHAGSCPVCGMELVKRSAAAAMNAEAGEKPLRLAILLFDGVEIIDYAGPWEVFGQASVHNHPAFEIYGVAQAPGPIMTAMGMSVNPKYTFANAPAPDVLLLPGGNVRPQLDNTAVLAWIGDASRQARVVFSVCNGAFFLAKAGLLDGLEATTFANLIPELRKEAPKARVVSDRRFVDNGKIVTAAGLSSGIDGALHVVEKLFGRGQAEVVATGLEYHWQPDSKWARATLADLQLNPMYGWVHQFADRTVVRHRGAPDRWETQWKLRTDKSGGEILKDLETIAEKEKWSPAAGGGESGRAWQFSDREGRAWKAAATVEPVSGDPKGRLLTVKIARGRGNGAEKPGGP
jgi:putative intracellular protease/amidase